MPPRKRRKPSPAKAIRKAPARPSRRECVCGDNCHDDHSHLPGLLLAAFGLLALPLNFGMIPGLEWALAWPVFFVIVGVVMALRVSICRSY